MSSHCDRDGMDLDSSSDQEAEAAVKPAKGWRPGKDCGSFDGFGTPHRAGDPRKLACERTPFGKCT